MALKIEAFNHEWTRMNTGKNAVAGALGATRAAAAGQLILIGVHVWFKSTKPHRRSGSGVSKFQ